MPLYICIGQFQTEEAAAFELNAAVAVVVGRIFILVPVIAGEDRIVLQTGAVDPERHLQPQAGCGRRDGILFFISRRIEDIVVEGLTDRNKGIDFQPTGMDVTLGPDRAMQRSSSMKTALRNPLILSPSC